MIVIGDKEEKSGKIALRIRGNKKIKKMKPEKFAEMIKKEVEGRK